MLSPKDFLEIFQNNDIKFFTGVPDSLLKSLCAYMQDNLPAENHIVAANEGGTVGLAAGYYLATGKIPAVYMQNSGVGNTVNPLLSLMDREVYNIPTILLVGWRGEPDTKDEPQHVKQGKITIPLLNVMGIKNVIMSADKDTFSVQLKKAIEHIEKTKEPFAFVIKKGTFEDYKTRMDARMDFPMSRETALRIVVNSMNETDDATVSTTGMISRELFEYREAMRQGHERDFLTVGSMGHASQIALGIKMHGKARKVYCLDGDGAVLMHTGALAIIGSVNPDDFVHIVFNNGAHDSVGGQPTVGLKVNFPRIALSCGYENAVSVETEEALRKTLEKLKDAKGAAFIEIKVKKGARKDLGRPTTTPVQNKLAFMNFLSELT
jgi:phosphonopyruvate decarboxylase